MKYHLFAPALFAALVLLGLAPITAQEPATAQMTDTELSQSILKTGDNTTATRNIALAVKANRPNVLLAVALDPTLSRNSEAIIALSQLPMHETAQAYAEILKTDLLWKPAQLGGRFGAIQSEFAARLKAALSTTCGINTTQADLFDANTRRQIIVILQKK